MCVCVCAARPKKLSWKIHYLNIRGKAYSPFPKCRSLRRPCHLRGYIRVRVTRSPKWLRGYSLSWVLVFLLLELIFLCLSHRKTWWTALTYFFWRPRTPCSLAFFLGVNWSGPGRVQHPITDFTGPWDGFMVHGREKSYQYGNVGHRKMPQSLQSQIP